MKNCECFAPDKDKPCECPPASEANSGGVPGYATCATCGYRWPYGMDGSHQCSAYLKTKLDRAEWLIARIFEDLPRKRDWLNPDYEKEMRFIAET